MGRFSSFLIGVLFTFSGYAADPGCSGRMREVVPLGGEERVAAVEAINEARSAELTRYTGDLSVQELLQGQGRFGFVAIRNEQVAGFIVYETRGRYVQVISVAVAESLRGQGVGHELLKSTIAAARQIPGIDDVRVMLRLDDESANALFTKSEFIESEIISGRFDAQTHSGRLMKLSLAGKDRNGQVLHEPQLQLAPKPQPRRRVAVDVLPVTREFLHQIDPTLENAW